jgi:adenylate kinase
VAALLDRGELVPDDLMVAVVAAALGERARDGYVLDGFPRTLPQAEATERAGGPLAPPDVAVHLSLTDRAVHERLEGRAGEQDRSDDADPAVIDRRLAVYREESEPLLDHYRAREALVTVDGDQPPPEVTEAILAALAARRHAG